MHSIKNQWGQSKENLYFQLHEGIAPPRLLAFVNYDKRLLDRAVLQRKVDNIEAEIK